MGFNSVYQTLKEVFPKVDIRVLKAVAIEHPKDPDEALNHILEKVLPFIPDTSNAAQTHVTSNSTPPSMATPSPLNHVQSLDNDDSISSSFYDTNADNDQLKGIQKSVSISPESSQDIGCGPAENEGFSVPSHHRETDLHATMTGDALPPFINSQDVDDMQLLNCIHNSSSYEHPDLDTLKDQPSTYHNSLEHEREADNAYNGEAHQQVDADGAESEPLLSSIVTPSGQTCRVNLVDIIEEAKNYKDTLYSARESVIELMEEVELQETEAEQAIIASTRGELDILEKVEEIRKTLKHAKEANDMHAGEVYGEKSILATEVKELQARLLDLSNEKDKSLSILDETRTGLQERLSIAEERRREAEKVLFDKQENARAALAEQELIMDKVVEESKMLNQEAEENAKLREFLMEKGQVVDVLQGEMSVISQDVKLLKEKIENRVSLRKSLSSSHSSVKSMEGSGEGVGRKERPWYSSMETTASLKSTSSSGECETPRSEFGGGSVVYKATAQKPLSDEEWEVCDTI